MEAWPRLGRVLTRLGPVLGSSWRRLAASGRNLEASWAAGDPPEGQKNKQKREEKRNKPLLKKLRKTNAKITFFIV